MICDEVQVGSLVSKSADETRRIAGKVAKILPAPVVVLLVGELGSGKTTFVQGFGGALEVKEQITSPAFLLMKEYQGTRTLRHIDLYRLEKASEVAQVGIHEDIPENGFVVVEWGERFDLGLNLPKLIVEFQVDETSEHRKLNFSVHGFSELETVRLKDALRNY